MLTTMAQASLLSTIRALPEEAPPSRVDQILTQLLLENNHLEDLKAKSDITNELLLELIEVMRGKARSDSAPQAGLIRNKPSPSIVRRRG